MAASPDKTDEAMRQSAETWALFSRLGKWTVILCVIALLGMAAFLTGAHNTLR
jgi:hypothetical protein